MAEWGREEGCLFVVEREEGCRISSCIFSTPSTILAFILDSPALTARSTLLNRKESSLQKKPQKMQNPKTSSGSATSPFHIATSPQYRLLIAQASAIESQRWPNRSGVGIPRKHTKSPAAD